MHAARAAIGRWRGGWTALVIAAVARSVTGTVLALLLVSLIPAAFAWKPTVVLTASMEPRIHVGDVVISRPFGVPELRIGQVLLIDDPDRAGRLRLHRFVKATDDGRLVMRGDANAQADSSTVSLRAVRGIACLRVPWVGLPTAWLAAGLADQAALMVGAAGLVLAACFAFQEDVVLVRGGPPERRRGRRRRLRRMALHLRRAVRRLATRRARAATAALLVAVLSTGWAVPAQAAPLSGKATNPGNAFATKSRFTCPDRVNADTPLDYWKLSEASGTTATDQTGARTGTYSNSGVTYGVAGPCAQDGDTAVTLDGGAAVGVRTATAFDPTVYPTFSEEVWFKTTTTGGGVLLGIGSSPTATTGTWDRVIAMTTAGKVAFGIGTGNSSTTAITATSSSAYNDGAWHLATAVYVQGTGAKLYVDGTQVATSGSATQYTATIRYWRIGNGDLNSTPWTASGLSSVTAAFTGSLAGAAVYGTALSAAQVAGHSGARSTAPTCTETIVADAPARYWRMSEANGTAGALDYSGNSLNGTYASSGVTYGVAGPCTTEGKTAVTLAGTATSGVTAHGTFDTVTISGALTTEVWFKASTGASGALFGVFGQESSGAASNLLYMDTNGAIAWGTTLATGKLTLATSESWRDGTWHHALGTVDGTKAVLYIDGIERVSSVHGSFLTASAGRWRVGFGSLSGWPNGPTGSFAGSVAGAATYNSVLSSTRIAAHAAAR